MGGTKESFYKRERPMLERESEHTITPTGTMPLIGQIPLEGLDLIVDPGTREVRVRLESGPEYNLLRAAA